MFTKVLLRDKAKSEKALKAWDGYEQKNHLGRLN